MLSPNRPSPTWSAIRARRRLSGQEPDQRSGTSVTARPEEQFAPNRPILSLLPLCRAMRSCKVILRSDTPAPYFHGSRPNLALLCSLGRAAKIMQGLYRQAPDVILTQIMVPTLFS